MVVDSAEAAIVESSSQVLSEIMAIPASGITRALLADAKAIAILPGLLKGGFVVGIRYGRGVVVVGDEHNGWQAPTFITITGGSFGWQVGIQATDLILVFKTKKGVDGLMRGKFTLGVTRRPPLARWREGPGHRCHTESGNLLLLPQSRVVHRLGLGRFGIANRLRRQRALLPGRGNGARPARAASSFGGKTAGCDRAIYFDRTNTGGHAGAHAARRGRGTAGRSSQRRGGRAASTG